MAVLPVPPPRDTATQRDGDAASSALQPLQAGLPAVPRLQAALEDLPAGFGTLFVKADHALPVAGSIKARGGTHEVLEHAEALALRHGLLAPDGGCRVLAAPAACALFARHQVAVGSTGPAMLHGSAAGQEFLRRRGLDAGRMDGTTHVACTAGGRFAPDEEYARFLARGAAAGDDAGSADRDGIRCRT